MAPRTVNFQSIRNYASFIRFSHSVFALPFALTGALLAFRARASAGPVWDGTVGGRVLWILMAMVAARSAAMGFNRLVDARHDALNPRTSMRELPRGAMTRREAVVFVVTASVLFVYFAYQLGPLCFALSPVALAIVFWYSLAKRFTSYTQLFLGLAMAVAPVGAWIAVRGDLDAVPVVLGFAVLAWAAGFDTIYSCQDAAFDRATGLHSIPARWGVRRALRFARGMHVAAAGLLALVYVLTPLHPLYLAGVAAIALGLAYEHSLVRHDDLSRVDAAFFTVNGWISVAYLAVVVVARRLATL